MIKKEDIIKYILYTPYNPNRAVLESLLESYLKDNGGGIILEDKIIIVPELRGNTNFSPLNPKPGDKVTITPNPDEGYHLSNIVVVDLEGNNIELTDNGDNTYSYIQPSNGTSVVPIVDYDADTINPEDTIIYNGGGVSGW